MLTRTSKHALRAVVHLALYAEACPIPCSVIARDVGIPPKYLGQVLGKLVRAGVLVASRGTGGGFRLARLGRDISLKDVISPFEATVLNRQRCPFGNEECDRDDPCAGHSAWRRIGDAFHTFLANTSVADLAPAPLRRARKKNGGR